jgi:chromosome segregation ATPase
MSTRTAVSHRLQRIENATLALAVATLILALAPPAFAAKPLKHIVALADLSQIDEEILWVLRDRQHDVHTAETAYEGTKVDIDAAKDELKLSREAQSQASADNKAAKAELSAAKKSGETERLAAATEQAETANAARKDAKFRVQWANKQLTAVKNQSTVAMMQLDLAKADLELANAKLLEEQGVAAATSYVVSDFQLQRDKIEATVDKTQIKTDRLQQKADHARLKFGDRAATG